MGSKNSNRGASHSPREFVLRWQRQKVARLSDIGRTNLSVEVITESLTNGRMVVGLAPTSEDVPLRLSSADHHAFAWGLHLKTAPKATRSHLATTRISIAGVPTIEIPGYGTEERPIEPYNDRLFQGGDVEATPLDAESLTAIGAPLSLGVVIGLTLVTPRPVTVWQPPR